MNKAVFSKVAMVIFAVILSGCASNKINCDDETPNKSLVIDFQGDPSKKKSIFVFMDGTTNDTSSGTNVVRLFDLIGRIQNTDDKQITAKYIPGVGTSQVHDFTEHDFLGPVFGKGLKARMEAGYDFLAKNYAPGDDIYIFGFSRGAHSARALAGFVSYVGIPLKTATSTKLGVDDWDKIIKMTQKTSDSDYVSYWNDWAPGRMPPLADGASKELGVDFQPAEVKLLGVWDTVPGSLLKHFDTCRERPGGSDGDRYKSDSYPSIRSIAHAVSIDEKRSKFKPLLVCPAGYPSEESLRPKLTEKWFPGAHSDVGGGYSDGNNDLPNISFNWMVGILATSYAFPTPPEKLPENPNGLAHWSVGDLPMPCKDRVVPPGARDVSAGLRTGQPPIRVKGKVKNYPYPIMCADEKRLLDVPEGG